MVYREVAGVWRPTAIPTMATALFCRAIPLISTRGMGHIQSGLFCSRILIAIFLAFESLILANSLSKNFVDGRAESSVKIVASFALNRTYNSSTSAALALTSGLGLGGSGFGSGFDSGFGSGFLDSGFGSGFDAATLDGAVDAFFGASEARGADVATTSDMNPCFNRAAMPRLVCVIALTISPPR
jgi:hypothetical protein